MSDWIELKIITAASQAVNPLSLQAYRVLAVQKTRDGGCRVVIDDDSGSFYEVAEPYETVIKKVIGAQEPADFSNRFIERFSKDEYGLLVDACAAAASDSKTASAETSYAALTEKLKEILKEKF